LKTGIRAHGLLVVLPCHGGHKVGVLAHIVGDSAEHRAASGQQQAERERCHDQDDEAEVEEVLGLLGHGWLLKDEG